MIEELIRVVAYGGLGVLLGYLVGVYVSDRHRLVSAVLDEAEKDVPTRRRLLSGASLNSFIVIVLMLMMLLTGLVWLQADQENAAQDRRECVRSVAVTQTLRERTANYLSAAEAERKWLIDLRKSLIALGVERRSSLVQALDDFRREQRLYVEHLKDNPYPRNSAEDC